MRIDTSLPGGSPGTSDQKLLDEFRASGLLDGLNDEDGQRLFDDLRPVVRTYLHDEFICQSGAKGTAFWILRNGEVCIEDFASGGSPQYLRQRTKGAFLGEVAYLTSERRRTASMKALGSVEVFEIHYAWLDSLEDPVLRSKLFLSLARVVANKFGEANKHRAQLIAEKTDLTQLARKFIPQSGLSAVGSASIGLRPEYQSETAVILFSDIVGFSDIAANLTPEETAKILKRVLDAQDAAIRERHGEIDKFIGDAVMAFWIVQGHSDANRQHSCIGALNAALGAVAEVARILNPLNGSPLEVRIGLHIGTAYSGNFGGTNRWAYTLIGHHVNIAARAEQARDDDVQTGHPRLGAVRVTHDFMACLPPEEQAKLPHQSDVRVKHTELKIFSSPAKKRAST